MSVDEQTEPQIEPAGAVGLDVPVAPRPRALPVDSSARLGSVDVIRGVAVLGILAMNIVGFAWPGAVYSVPIMEPEAGGVSVGLWAVNHLVFDTKMMTLFSMLFGAGLVLMGDRAEARGAKFRGVYYRRVGWLLVIGLIHSYLIWDGDILVLYALCGFLLYPFRRLRPRTLIVTGIAFNLIFVVLLVGFRVGGIPYMKATAARAEAETKAGRKPSWWDDKVREGWVAMNKSEKPKREEFLKGIADHRTTYFEMVKTRAKSLIWGQTIGFPLVGWWMAGGRMLIGMGLMKLGVFGAGLSKRAYVAMVAVGYGVGVPLLLYDSADLIGHGFYLEGRMAYMIAGWPLLAVYASLFVVLGHIGLVMLIVRAGLMTWLTRRLAAVGRMALSNYLFDSIACTTFFYGYGLDYFGTTPRSLLTLMVLAIWTGQLLVCPIWLEAFRFGPAEWIWRSLTYWRIQPIRQGAA